MGQTVAVDIIKSIDKTDTRLFSSFEMLIKYIFSPSDLCIVIQYGDPFFFFIFQVRARVGPGLALEYEGRGQVGLARPLRARARAGKIG